MFAEVIPRHLIILGDVVLWQFLQRSTCEVSRNQSKVWLNLEAGEDIGKMREVWRHGKCLAKLKIAVGK